MSHGGPRRSGRNASSSPSSSPAAAQHTSHSFASTQHAALSSSAPHDRPLSRSSRSVAPNHPPHAPPPASPPSQPQSQSQSQSSFSQLLHDPERNFVLTPLTPAIPVSLRSRSQQQLDGLCAAVLMYVLHRHTALLPVRVNDINNKVLKDTARGAGRVVLKDVARRLRTIFGLRLVEAGKAQPVSAATGSVAATTNRAAEVGSSGGTGRKRGRSNAAHPRAAANSATSASDAYIVVVDRPLSGRQQVQLSSDGTDSTTPRRLLSSWRAHSALLFATLALCAFTYKDGVIAEERLLFLLGGLFGLGSARELRQTTAHVLFGDVPELITHTWVEQQYLERSTLQSEDVGGNFTVYGAVNSDSKEPHYRVGVRGRLEVGYERLYRFMVEEVMDSEVSEAGVKEMQRRDAVEAATTSRSEWRVDEERKQVQAQDEFAFTQPAANRRSNAAIALPQEQSRTQRLAPYQQSVLRYLLAHSVAPEPAVLAYYRQTSPPSPRSPDLDELFTAINVAIEWAALRVERVASEYADERVWMLVSRSDADSTLVFSAFSSEEVALFRAWLQTLVAVENDDGAAAMTVQDMEAIAAQLDGLGSDRARRLAKGSRELAERLTSHGWLHSHRRVEPQLYSIGMRSFIELLMPRALAAAAAASSLASASSASPASSSSTASGGLPLRLHECGRCRFDVYYGVYCGTQQDEQAECRQKYHYHCVQRVRQAGQTMKCRAGHTWKPRPRQRHDSALSDGQPHNEQRADTDSRSSGDNKGTRHSLQASQQQPPREYVHDQQQQQPPHEEAAEDSGRPMALRRRLKKG